MPRLHILDRMELFESLKQSDNFQKQKNGKWVAGKMETDRVRDEEVAESFVVKEKLLCDLAALGDSQNVLSELRKLDWNFEEAETDYLTHDIHTYPAKFPPQIPSQLISLLSLPGELVWDPFGGSGTTALEALLQNRRCISSDANPISELIGRAKTLTLTRQSEKELKSLIYDITRPEGQLSLDNLAQTERVDRKTTPPIPNIEKWFNPNAVRELGEIRLRIDGLRHADTRTLALVAFSRIITRASNQDSETRYSARLKHMKEGDVLNLYASTLLLIMDKVKLARRFLKGRVATFLTLNAAGDITSTLDSENMITENSVDLIVTSPPYPNATDYYLYNRFRLYWLGFAPQALAGIEIGSHLRHQKMGTGFEDYIEEMRKCLANMFAALRPGRYVAMIVGDAIFREKLYSTSAAILTAAASIGFETVGVIPRNIHKFRRSFIAPARRATDEKIVILRKRDRELDFRLEKAQYRPWPYEYDLQSKEIESLTGVQPHTTGYGWSVNMRATSVDKLRRLTFVRNVSATEYSPELTWQARLEYNGYEYASQRKNSKYLSHGVHPYKGKFYPQLAKAIINLSLKKSGARILDPFCGSGTVLLEGYLNGFESFGCDLNPLAVEIAKSKVDILDVDPISLEQYVIKIRNKISKNPDFRGFSTYFRDNSLREIERWFPGPVVQKLGWLLTQIDEVENQDVKRFLRVILSSTIKSVSQQDPTDLRTRRRRKPLLDAPLFELFEESLCKIHQKISSFTAIREYALFPMHKSKIWQGDSRDISQFFEHEIDALSLDAVVTSPPYATALPYIDTDRLSILTILGISSRERSNIEETLTGSREITNSNREDFDHRIETDNFQSIGSELAKKIIKRIYELNKGAEVGFRRLNMGALLFRYYEDMTTVFQNIDQLVKHEGSISVVIGDNYTTAGERKVLIPTTNILEQIGEATGWKLDEALPITVTTEGLRHIHNAITKNTVLRFVKP